ncbi:hypothetical protein D3C76_1104940 [compost metagenome]
MHADIDKGTKIGDVRYRAFQHHSRLQIFHRFNAFGKLRRFKRRARVATWFFQLFDDVGDGWHAEFVVGKIDGFQITQIGAVAHQVFQRLLSGSQNTLHHRISFRVNG